MAQRIMVGALMVLVVVLSVLGTLFVVERLERGRLAAEVRGLEAEIEQLRRELDVIESGS